MKNVCATNEPTRQSNDNNNCKNAHITLSMVWPCANCTDTLTQSRTLKPVAFHSCILYNVLNLDRRTSVRLTLTDFLRKDLHRCQWNFPLNRSQIYFRFTKTMKTDNILSATNMAGMHRAWNFYWNLNSPNNQYSLRGNWHLFLT